jgi:hypothetical protein
MLKERRKILKAGKRALTLVIGASTMAVALSTIAPVAQAATQTSTRTPVPAPCRIAASVGDYLYLWKCDGTAGTRNGYHAQEIHAHKGDRVYVKSNAGNTTGGVTASRDGVDLDSLTVGDNGGPWAACFTAFPELFVTCTDHAW